MGDLMKAWSTIAIALALAGCEKSGGPGKERGACYGNGTCDPGLVCMSELCVRPPPADCAKVAEKLASYRLGNYAPKEERAKVIGELTGKCEEARLSVDEGKCILEAQGRMEIAQCPRPLLDELAGDKDGCKAVADQVARFFVDAFSQQGMGDRSKAEKFAPEIASAIQASCVEDAWPDAPKRCFLMAASFDDMGDCQDAFPEELEDRVEKRLEPVIEKIMKLMMNDGSAPTTPPATPPPVTPPPTTIAPPPGATTGALPATIEAACAGYLARMERFMACDKVPKESRDAARQGIDAMKDAWKQAGAMPAEAQKAMADACKQAEDALAQAMTATGCP
jgi:hypothetical protein